MQEIRTPAQEAAEDVFFGQIVMIWARWFIIAVGAVLVIWSANEARTLTLTIVPVVALMVINFYLHGRYLMEQPANRYLIGIAAALDLAIVSVIVLLGVLGKPGLNSQLFVLYYPVILGFGLVFRPRFTVIYTVATLVAYTLACVGYMSFNPADPDLKALVLRLITLAAMAGLSTYYWRILRNRRRTAQATPRLERLHAEPVRG